MTPFPERVVGRPTWLMTLADLALLLVGFFVLLQAHGSDDRALAGALRARFGDAAAPPRPMPVAAAASEDFAPGSAVLPRAPGALLDWARDAVRDPRVSLAITGGVDGSAADVDPATGSGVVLAADRARALAAALAPVSRRLAIVTAVTPGRRAATVTIGFTGAQP